jgi:isoleucyl-tRNA synthetase
MKEKITEQLEEADELKHDWEYIHEFPQSYRAVHESIYRSYQVLEEVTKMLKRKDSHKTILKFISFVTDK